MGNGGTENGSSDSRAIQAIRMMLSSKAARIRRNESTRTEQLISLNDRETFDEF